MQTAVCKSPPGDHKRRLLLNKGLRRADEWHESWDGRQDGATQTHVPSQLPDTRRK